MPAPLAGQVVLSGTAQQVTTPKASVSFSIKAPLSNVKPAFIGPVNVTLTTGYQLDPGDVFEYAGSSQNGQPLYTLGVSDLYVVGTSPDVVTWFASP